MINSFPRPKDLSLSFKAKEDIVKLIREWERIDGGDYHPTMRKAAYLRALPEDSFKKFKSDVNLDLDSLGLPEIEHRLEVYIRNNMADKAKDLGNLDANKDKEKEEEKAAERQNGHQG